MSEQQVPPRPGRKRSEESRLAILAAAFELIAEVGYAGLTIEGIAARSGTGKQTIYRWWPSKADVLMDAIAQDKKVKSGKLTFILTRGVGQSFVADDVPASEVISFLREKHA
jgi:AcrR family transcriptional regulator